MKDDGLLEAAWTDYREGKTEQKALAWILYEYIRENPKLFYVQDFRKDAQDDFLTWVWPRLYRGIGNYREKGSSFSAYIITMVRYSAREFQRQEQAHRFTEQAYWESVSDDLNVRSEEPVYEAEYDTGEKVPIKRVSNPRQVLILLLKAYNQIPDTLIERAAPALGISRNRLFRLLDKLRGIRLKQDMTLRSFRDRIFCQYYRCKTFERRRNAAPEDSPGRAVMQGRLERAEQRLASMKRYYRTLKTGASNRQIARLLGIPKGTVDSTLFAAWKKFRAGDKPLSGRRGKRHGKDSPEDDGENGS